MHRLILNCLGLADKPVAPWSWSLNGKHHKHQPGTENQAPEMPWIWIWLNSVRFLQLQRWTLLICINKYDWLTLNSEGGDNWEDSFYCGTFLHNTKSGRNMFEKAHFISLIWILPSPEATWQNSTKRTTRICYNQLDQHTLKQTQLN